MLSLKEMVKGNKKVVFTRLFCNELWYKTEDGFEFPIPLEDTEGCTFNAEEKAFALMRWIRKHIDFINQAKKEQQP